MTPSAFERLYEKMGDSDQLYAIYDGLLKDLFALPLWTIGPIGFQRISWNEGERARTDGGETFRSPGLYLWGAEDRPLYVGITRVAFSRRFSRYIWNDRSQCKLAKTYSHELTAKGIDGFPIEITDWYARNFPGTRVRLVGATRFAQEGIEKIWFALLPHSHMEQIRELERVLIPVAEKWNELHSLRPLLNIQEQKRRN